MVVHKKKKNKRMRGTQTHGWGAKKKHRGSGNRGGKGMAGTGKRSHGKKPMIWAERYFGKFGFIHHGINVSIKPINIADIENRLEKFVALGAAKKDGNAYTIDLEKLGYNKLLSKGNAKSKLKIHVDYASANAIEKIKKAGGDVILSTKKEAESKPE